MDSERVRLEDNHRAKKRYSILYVVDGKAQTFNGTRFGEASEIIYRTLASKEGTVLIVCVMKDEE